MSKRLDRLFIEQAGVKENTKQTTPKNKLNEKEYGDMKEVRSVELKRRAASSPKRCKNKQCFTKLAQLDDET